VIALAWPGWPGWPGWAGWGGEPAGFHDHHRFFARSAEERWWSPETRSGAALSHAQRDRKCQAAPGRAGNRRPRPQRRPQTPPASPV